MKVLVIGQGGREHALVKAFSLSTSVTEIHCMPGNPGMLNQAICHAIDWRESEKIIHFCLSTEIDLVFIGPDDAVVDGLADRLRERGLYVVGPGKAGAQLEGSKVFAKYFMQEAGIPTARFQVIESVEQCLSAAASFSPPFVLKADGLAAGKGVVICEDLNELKKNAISFFETKIFGPSGTRALLEEFTPGWEMSFTVLTNGLDYQILPFAQDHKRLLEENKGPNTGGMGTISPIPLDEMLKKQIEDLIVKPTLKLINERSIPYRGVIFLGIMITQKGPSLIEYNCRLGDPETQVMLPLIDGDWGLISFNLAKGKLLPLKFKKQAACCVIMASPGYPDNVQKGIPIEGDPLFETDSSYFIHAGTQNYKPSGWVTNGGRVLGSIGVGQDLESARNRAYEQSKKVQWSGLIKRNDIGIQFVTQDSIIK